MNRKKISIPPISACLAILFAQATISCTSPVEEEILPQSDVPSKLSLKKVVIALKANKNPEKMLAEKEFLEAYLSKKLSREVEVLIPTDSSVVKPRPANCIRVADSFKERFTQLPKHLAKFEKQKLSIY